MSNGTDQRKLAAIMFTDMVGYSAQGCWVLPCCGGLLKKIDC